MDGILDDAGVDTARIRKPSRTARPDVAQAYFQQAEDLLDRRRFAEAESLLRAALRLRPDDADILNKLGCALWEQGRPAESEPLFSLAHEIRPDDAVILNHLGLARWDQGRPMEAEDCYRRALQLKPNLVNARMNLGVVLSDLGRFDEALVWLRRAVEAQPYSADGLQNLGMALARKGQWKDALEFYDRALACNPEYAEVHRNRAYAWLYLGDFERGWPEHEWRMKCRRHQGCSIDRPYWRGESLNREVIVLHAEQGYGDTLQFIRYATMVKQRGGLVFVLCHSRMLRIISRCPGVDLAFDGSSVTPDCKFHTSLMSLPAIFGTTLTTIPARVPYLFNDPVVLERWRTVLAESLATSEESCRGSFDENVTIAPERPFLIGVAWQGSPQHANDRWRSFPLAQLGPLARIPRVRLVNLQVEHGLDQLREWNGEKPIVELKSRPRDFLDTAAIVSQLDLVITPDTAIAHLAGGLGIPVWVAISTVAEWRWMIDRQDSPWYPTMRLFRQTTLEDWEGVFERMSVALRPILENRSISSF